MWGCGCLNEWGGGGEVFECGGVTRPGHGDIYSVSYIFITNPVTAPSLLTSHSQSPRSIPHPHPTALAIYINL